MLGITLQECFFSPKLTVQLLVIKSRRLYFAETGTTSQVFLLASKFHILHNELNFLANLRLKLNTLASKPSSGVLLQLQKCLLIAFNEAFAHAWFEPNAQVSHA